MQIKKKGFVYRVAYGLMDEEKQPYPQVDLCPLFWKFIWMFFVGWPLYRSFILAVNGGIYIIGFFFAYRPTVFEGEWETTKNLSIPYKRWPTTKTGKRILPFWLTLAILTLWLIYSSGKSVALATIGVATSLLFWKWVGGIICLAVVILLAAGFFNSEVWKLLKAWGKAQKARVCPIIDVVE